MAKQFTQINYDWYNLMPKLQLDMVDINLLGIINGLQNSSCGCIADDKYFESILNIPNIKPNIMRLNKANIIQIKNSGKIRRIIINKDMLVL